MTSVGTEHERDDESDTSDSDQMDKELMGNLRSQDDVLKTTDSGVGEQLVIERNQSDAEYYDASDHLEHESMNHLHDEEESFEIRHRTQSGERIVWRGQDDCVTPSDYFFHVRVPEVVVSICDLRHKEHGRFDSGAVVIQMSEFENSSDFLTLLKKSSNIHFNPPLTDTDDVTAHQMSSRVQSGSLREEFKKVQLKEIVSSRVLPQILFVVNKKDEVHKKLYFVSDDRFYKCLKLKGTDTINDLINIFTDDKSRPEDDGTLFQNKSLFAMFSSCALDPEKTIEACQFSEYSVIHLLPKISLQARGIRVRQKQKIYHIVQCTNADSVAKLKDKFVREINKSEGSFLTCDQICLTCKTRDTTCVLNSDQSVASALGTIGRLGYTMNSATVILENLWIHVLQPDSFSVRVRVQCRNDSLIGRFSAAGLLSPFNDAMPDVAQVICNKDTTIKQVKLDISAQTERDEDSLQIYCNQSVLHDGFCMGDLRTPLPTLTCVEQKPTRVQVNVTFDNFTNKIVKDVLDVYDHSTCQRLLEILVLRLNMQDDMKLDLFLDGTDTPLDREKSLKTSGVSEHPFVKAIYYPNRIAVFLKLREHPLSRLVIDRPTDFTVGQLKSYVMQKYPVIASAAVSVVWNGQCLIEGQTIDSCGIKHEDKIFVTSGSKKIPPSPFLTVFCAHYNDDSVDVEEWLALPPKAGETARPFTWIAKLEKDNEDEIMNAFASITESNVPRSQSRDGMELTHQKSSPTLRREVVSRTTILTVDSPHRKSSFEDEPVHSNEDKANDKRDEMKNQSLRLAGEVVSRPTALNAESPHRKTLFDDEPVHSNDDKENYKRDEMKNQPLRQKTIEKPDLCVGLNAIGQMSESSEAGQHVIRPVSLPAVAASQKHNVATDVLNETTQMVVTTATTTVSGTLAAARCSPLTSISRASPVQNDTLWYKTEVTKTTQKCYEHRDTGEVYVSECTKRGRVYQNRGQYQHRSASRSSSCLTSEDDAHVSSPDRPNDVNDETATGVGHEIGKEWKSLGRQLKLSNTELENIDHSYQRLKEKGVEMLLHWRNKNGLEATRAKLGKALVNCCQRRLAEEYNLTCTGDTSENE